MQFVNKTQNYTMTINSSYFFQTDVVIGLSPFQDSSSPVTMTTQSVIRPIPILPLDTSIYSSPPTYIDNLPPRLSVPMMPSVLIGNQLSKDDMTELPLSQVCAWKFHSQIIES